MSYMNIYTYIMFYFSIESRLDKFSVQSARQFIIVGMQERLNSALKFTFRRFPVAYVLKGRDQKLTRYTDTAINPKSEFKHFKDLVFTT